MKNVTIVSSYFNDGKLLTEHWFPIVEKWQNKADFIFVDDYSTADPADKHLFGMPQNWPVSLLRITEDIGFGSHCARNLAVSQAKTQQVLLTDIDAPPMDDLMQLIIERRNNNIMIIPSWHSSHPKYGGTKCPNTFTVDRDKFIAIKGYDEEMSRGYYGGDWWTRNNYMQHYQVPVSVAGTCPLMEELNGDREGNKEGLPDGEIKKMVFDRNARKDWSNKPWLSFEWEKVL